MNKFFISSLSTFLLSGQLYAMKTTDLTIWKAAAEGNIAHVEKLLANGTSVDSKDKRGNTPLLFAVRGDHYEIVQLLLAHRADVNTKGSIGLTPLHIAASHGLRAIIQLLLDNGADVNQKNNRDLTALHYAVMNSKCTIMQLLLNNPTDGSAKCCVDTKPLAYYTAEFCHHQIVRLLLNRGARVNASHDKGLTPLHLAASYGLYAIVQLFLNNHADVTIPDNLGHTPLHYAIRPGATNLLYLFEHWNDFKAGLHTSWYQSILLAQRNSRCGANSPFHQLPMNIMEHILDVLHPGNYVYSPEQVKMYVELYNSQKASSTRILHE